MNQIVNGFIREACDILNFDKTYVRVIYSPTLEEPFHYTLTPDGYIVLDSSWLAKTIDLERPSEIRCAIYMGVREWYQLFIKKFKPQICDTMTFAIALSALKGLLFPCPNEIDIHPLLDCAQKMLRDEFNANTEYYKDEEHIQKGLCPWRFRLTTEDETLYSNRYYGKPVISTVRIDDSIIRGTEENPFDNINDAFEFIKNLEIDAYNNDSVLKDIASQQYFYDLNSRIFRISWASPYVSFYRDPSIPDTGFIVNQNQAHKDGSFFFTFKPNLHGKKFLYRGQSQEYPGPCTPTLFRDEHKSYFLDDIIWSQEMELLIKSHPLVNLFEKGINIMHDTFSFHINVGGLAQHYYNKTHFLDLTSDVNAAKFFATTKYDRSKDTYSPIHNTEHLGVIYCYEIQMPYAFNNPKNYKLSVIGKQVFMRSGAQHGFLLSMEKGQDFKNFPEVRKFFFRHCPEISDEIFKKSNNGKLYFPQDILEEAWNTTYKDRLEKGIISTDTVELNVRRNPGETFDSIREKLLEKGIDIDKTRPSFPPELLDKYYDSIRNGWWEEFCSDIFFYGGDGPIYKDLLRRLPEREEYKKAFQR